MHHDALMEEKPLHFSFDQLTFTKIPHHIIPERVWFGSGRLAGVCRWQMPAKYQRNTSIVFQPFSLSMTGTTSLA